MPATAFVLATPRPDKQTRARLAAFTDRESDRQTFDWKAAMLRLRLADLAQMSEAARDSAIAELVEAARAPLNGQEAVLNSRIRHYERLYERSSDEMLAEFAAGKLKETADISAWLFWLEMRIGLER